MLFLSDHLGYAHGEIHGATSYFLTVLPALARRVALTVCFLRERHPAAARLEDEGVRPIFLGRARRDLRALLDLSRLIRRERIEIVHAAGMKGILFGRLAALLAKGPRPRTIIHLHDLKPPGRLLGAAQRALASRTGAAIAVSHAVADAARRDFAIPSPRVRVLWNPVQLERFVRPPEVEARAGARVRAEFGIDPGRPVIGVIGRFSREKGHEQLFRSLPDVLRSFPEAVLLAAGDGSLRAACERLAASLAISGSMRFAGHRTDVPDVLSAVDVVAVPSISEGFPYSALEAMASRRPVVAFAVGGLPEIIRHEENGLLAPAGDGAALAAGIVRVLRDKELAVRLIDGGARAVQHLSASAHVSQLVAVYDEVTAGAETRTVERMVEAA